MADSRPMGNDQTISVDARANAAYRSPGGDRGTGFRALSTIVLSLIIGLGLLIAFVSDTSTVDWSGPAAVTPNGAPLEISAEKAIFFEDGAEGTIIVRNADTDQVIGTLPFGEGGFVRQVMRGFVRARRLKDIGAEVPFILQSTADGLILIKDETLDRTVILNAFGVDNAAAFASLLANDAEKAAQTGTNGGNN